MAQKTTMAASIQSKKGRLYAVIQHKENGKPKYVWRSLGLPEDANKSKINKAFREVVNQYELEFAKMLEKKDRPVNDLPVFEYMATWLDKTKNTIQLNTYRSYRMMIYGKIRRYFENHECLTIGSIRAKDINEFYDTLSNDGVSASTIIHYHSVLRRAFQQAVEDEMLDLNPFDKAKRPKKNKFHGTNYSEDEMIKLLNLAESDPIYPAIMLAGGLGLRRSEALGVRWSRIDWEGRYVLLDTKIVEYKEKGKCVLIPVQEMKNKSSRRTLPLPTPVFEMLQKEKAKQELYRKMFRGSYSREYEDYVCVNQLGELLKPSYVTAHFHDLLENLGMRKIRFHDLRHTFASLLINQNVPLINVSNFLGHSDISTTANIYAHLDKASKIASAEIITSIFSEKGGN